MNREDVHCVLGEPQGVKADGTEMWSVQDGSYVAMRTFKFSSSGKILEITDPGLVVGGSR